MQKKITDKLLISERFQNHDAYLTIKDRKECFPHNRSFSHIPVKLEKPFWTKWTNKLHHLIQVKQWKNSSAVIKWFRNIENTPNIFYIRYPGLLLISFVIRGIEFGKEIYKWWDLHLHVIKENITIHWWWTMFSKRWRRWFQWAATMEQRCVSWLAHIC